MDSANGESAAVARWPPAFRAGLLPAVAFVLAFALWAMVSNGLFGWLFGPDPSVVSETLWNLPSGVVQFAIAVVALRYEGVRLRDLGLSGRHLRRALVATAGFVIAVNAVVAGLVLAGDTRLSVGAFAFYRSPPLNLSLTAVAASVVAEYAFVGPVEELAFRGYLQNKLIAVLDWGSARTRTAIGIVTAGCLFSLVHVPTLLLLRDVPPGQLTGSLVLLALTGVTFGTIYALTRNLFLVMFLHGIGNFWPLVVDPGVGAWPNWGAVLVLYALVVALYRRWPAGARGSGRGDTNTRFW